MTALEVLSEALDRGLSLSARGDGLVAGPNRRLSPDFAHKLCEFKPALLPLLQTKGITWIEDTRDELRILVAQNRIKPLMQAELRKVYEIKRTFGVRIAE